MLNYKNYAIMYNYLLILNGKNVKGYNNLKRALKGFDLLQIRKKEEDYIELISYKEGIIKESY